MPSGESRQPSWNDVLDAATGAALRGVHTAMLGKILSYDAAAQTASVELAVHLPRASGEFAAVSPVEGPVLWPGAWAAGDRCLVVFLEESAAKWLETGSVEAPDFQMRHGLHPVVLPFPSIEGQTVQFVALGNLVQAQLADLKSAINGWTPVPNDGGAALKVALTSWLASSSAVSSVKVKAR